MSKVKNDGLASKLFLLFLCKPIIDLFWRFSLPLGVMKISPLQAAGVAVFCYFGWMMMVSKKLSIPCRNLFFTFIVFNFVSIAIGFISGDISSVIGVVNFVLRVFDSYIIYNVAYRIAMRNSIEAFHSLVKYIVIGGGLSGVINLVGILLGYGGAKEGASSAYSDLRESGLYYDPGVLSNMALFSVIFALFYLYLKEKRAFTRMVSCMSVVLIGLYLIYLGKSRSVMIQIAVVALIYWWFINRGIGKILVPVVVVIAGTIAVATLDMDTEGAFKRFEGDLETLQGIFGGKGSTSSSNFVSDSDTNYKELEKLGSNRGKNWTAALEEIFNRSAFILTFGNFQSTVAHSDYIDILGRNGLVGLCVYLWLIFGLFFKTLRLARSSRRREQKVLHTLAFTLISLYILYSIPFRPLSYTTTAWYMWAVLGFSMAYSYKAADDQSGSDG